MGIASAHQFQIQLEEAKRANNLSHSSHNLGKGWQATTDTSSIGLIITQRFALRFLIPTGYSHEDKRKSNRLVGHPLALALRKFGSASKCNQDGRLRLEIPLGDLWSRRTSKRLIKPLMPGISNMLLLLEAAVHVIFHTPSPALGATVFGTTT